MGEQFAWFYDVAIVALLVICIYIGWKRGFLLSFIMIVGYVISFAVSFFISGIISPIIYDNFVHPKVSVMLEEKISEIDILAEIQKIVNENDFGIEISKEEISSIIENSSGDIGADIEKVITERVGVSIISKEEINEEVKGILDSKMVQSFVESLPSYLQEIVADYFADSEESLITGIKALVGTPATTAAYIEETIIAPTIIPVIKFIAFLIIFTIALILVKIISKVFRRIKRIPILGSVNSLLGAIFGALQGIAIILLIAIILHGIIALSKNELVVLNDVTIEQTNLFKIAYNADLFK